MQQNDKTINKTTNIIITEDFASQRIDNFLLNKLKNIPKSRIYTMLRKGEVRVNKKRIRPNYRLQPNDEVRIPPFWCDALTPKKTPSAQAINLLKNNIIFENAGLLVINKPAGMAAHGGSGINFGVIETMRAARPELQNLELVHRLDRDTSGCLMLAKKRSMLRALHQLIREGKIVKRYLALVRGKWTLGTKQVTLPLLKNQLLSGERMVQVSADGKSTLTIFKPQKVFSQASLLAVTLHTGRTHQIRVHAATLGHPIAGDDKYGDKDFNATMRSLGLKRLFLHAEVLEFTLPDGTPIRIKANLSSDLAKLLEKLEKF